MTLIVELRGLVQKLEFLVPKHRDCLHFFSYRWKSGPDLRVAWTELTEPQTPGMSLGRRPGLTPSGLCGLAGQGIEIQASLFAPSCVHSLSK